MDRNELIHFKLKEFNDKYDEKEALLSSYNSKWVGGYHTRRTGVIHGIKDSAEYSAAILQFGDAELYPRAFQILSKVCELQDQDPESKTFGLWSYYMEEDLRNMIVPDYNWADFVSKNLIGVMIHSHRILPEELKKQLRGAIENAVVCSIRRNVSPDYTNISLMSCMTIISGGELLNHQEFLRHGKERLEKLYEYTQWNSAFTEYNSSAYILVALCEISRMLSFFKDTRCFEIAHKLNEYAWECLTLHFNTSIGQLTPPQTRAYRDLENGSLSWCIYQGTEGKYGHIPEISSISLDSLMFPSICPEQYIQNLKGKERWIAHTYYKKNDLRSSDEDNTIIRDLNSPDQIAYSYITDTYSMGVFQVSDCWNQRRNSMVVWGKDKPCYFRIRGICGDYDFCSGMVYAHQYKQTILGQVGLVTDRGSFHYILDKKKDGTYETNNLYFHFEIGGQCDDVIIKQSGNAFIITDQDITITLTIHKWIYDGNEGQVRWNKDTKSIDLIGFDQKESRYLDTNKLNETYGVYSICVNHPDIEEVNVVEENGVLVSTGISDGQVLSVKSPVTPVTFIQASLIAVT